jgi:hypothetical protein
VQEGAGGFKEEGDGKSGIVLVDAQRQEVALWVRLQLRQVRGQLRRRQQLRRRAGGLWAWALQQLLAQKTGQSNDNKKSGGGGQQDSGYAARMTANRLQYPCNGCGVLGHWKRDGECNPKDVAAYIKKKMEEQSKRDAEEDDDNEPGTKHILQIL